MVIDAVAPGVCDDRPMDDEVMDEQQRRRMTSKQLERRSLPDDEASMAVSKRQKREATIVAIRKRFSRWFPRRGQIWSRRTHFT